MDELCPVFEPPDIPINMPSAQAAKTIRTWLGDSENSHTMGEWKQLLENKGVFILLTSKYKGWSHIDRSLLRGLSIHHKALPIIIINDSDAKKAQIFYTIPRTRAFSKQRKMPLTTGPAPFSQMKDGVTILLGIY